MTMLMTMTTIMMMTEIMFVMLLMSVVYIAKDDDRSAYLPIHKWTASNPHAHANPLDPKEVGVVSHCQDYSTQGDTKGIHPCLKLADWSIGGEVADETAQEQGLDHFCGFLQEDIKRAPVYLGWESVLPLKAIAILTHSLFEATGYARLHVVNEHKVWLHEKERHTNICEHYNRSLYN